MTAPTRPTSEGTLLYDGFTGSAQHGSCRIRVWHRPLDGGLPIAVVTEQDDNPGPSITNCAENVHAAISHYLGGTEFRHVEHYDRRGRSADTYDLVTVEAGQARWQHMDPEELALALGEMP